MCGGPEKSVVHGAKVDAITDKKNTAVQKKINVSILEMEDVLFHHNSAVMMPESPVESPVDEKGTEKQEKLTGVKALALIFKQFEFDPEKKIIIAGHTDSSGETKYNFGLSELRAQNVLYLLTNDRDNWAKVSYARHKVEDYQQIMKHAFLIRKWRCDPWKVDNKWGDKTENATREFITAYNRFEKEQSLNHPLKISDLMREIKNDGQKRWPVKLWEAVFELYCYDLCQILTIKREELKEAGQKAIKFVDDKNKYVPCGESFPIDQAQKDNYRSQTNRRVEILVFDKDEQAVEIKCPKNDDGTPKWNTKHTKDQCPLWHDLILRPTYLSAKDLYAVTYHMVFTYFDKVKNKVMNVPEGLGIKAYQDGTEKETVVTYDSGKKIYNVKVRYDKPLKELTGIKLHFEFKEPNKWVYTKNKDSDPVIFPGKDENKDIQNLKKTDAYKDITKVEDLKKLNLPGSLNFYDLPAEWSSVNYWTRYKGSDGKDTGERFQKVIADADKMHLKPMGSKLTKPDKPLVFSFDDIVLIDKKGQQNINDNSNTVPKDKNETDTPINLTNDSRYTLYYVKDEKLLQFKPETGSNPSFTDFKFKENLIYDVPTDGVTRLIIFANDLYSVSNRRTVKDAKFKSAKHVLGCRAATLDDKTMHYVAKERGDVFDTATTITLTNGSSIVNGNGTTFLRDVIPGYKLSVWGAGEWNKTQYTVASIQSNTRLTLTGNPVGADVGAGKYFKTFSPQEYCVGACGNFELHYIHDGCVISDPSKAGNHKVRSFLLIYWNGRYEASGAGVNAGEVKTFANEGSQNTKKRWESKDYSIEPQTVDAQNKGKLQIKPVFHFETKNSGRGGSHKCKVSITNNSNDGEMGVKDSKMYKKSYKSPATIAASEYKRGEQEDIDGSKYWELIMAHEYGHGTGKYDDYEYTDGSLYSKDDNFFRQWYPGMPYQFDFKSMMWYTEAPRLKQLWNFVNRFNDACQNNSELKNILNGTKYKIVHRFTKDGANKTYNFYLPDKYRDICKPYKSGDTSFAAAKAATGTQPAVQGKGDFTNYLYKIGEDETAWSIKINSAYKNWVFNGILLVYIKIGFKFIDYKKKTGPTSYTTQHWSSGTAPNKSTWMNAVRSFIMNKLNGQFYLEGNDADFKRTYLYFFPVCLDLDAKATGTQPADYTKANYTIKVVYNGYDKVPEPTSPTTLEVGSNVSRQWIARYLFGQDASWTGANQAYHPTDESQPAVQKKVRNIGTGTAVAFQASDLEFIRDWLRSELGDNSFNLTGTPKP